MTYPCGTACRSPSTCSALWCFTLASTGTPGVPEPPPEPEYQPTVPVVEDFKAIARRLKEMGGG